MFFASTTFTLLHVALSLIGIVAGFIAVIALLQDRKAEGWTLTYFVTTVLTSVTGFLFPFTVFLPSHGTGVISLIVLALALAGRYIFHFAGPWRWIYAVGLVLGLYFNVFVLVVQMFQKIPALHALAPTQSEAPFAVAQIVVLAIFVWLCFAAAKRFRPAPAVA